MPQPQSPQPQPQPQPPLPTSQPQEIANLTSIRPPTPLSTVFIEQIRAKKTKKIAKKARRNARKANKKKQLKRNNIDTSLPSSSTFDNFMATAYFPTSMSTFAPSTRVTPFELTFEKLMAIKRHYAKTLIKRRQKTSTTSTTRFQLVTVTPFQLTYEKFMAIKRHYAKTLIKRQNKLLATKNIETSTISSTISSTSSITSTRSFYNSIDLAQLKSLSIINYLKQLREKRARIDKKVEEDNETTITTSKLFCLYFFLCFTILLKYFFY